MSRQAKIEAMLAVVESDLSSRLRTLLPEVAQSGAPIFTNRDFNPHRLLPAHYGTESDALLELAYEAQRLRGQVGLPTDSGPAHLYLEACHRQADLRDSNRLGPRRMAERLLRALDSGELDITTTLPELIPTASKDRLTSGFSYAVSASEISEALAAVPQFDDISLSFWTNDTFSASTLEWQRRIQDLESVSLLHASNSQISLFAVPSRYKRSARRKLLAEGLPSLADALTTAVANPYRFHYSVDLDLAAAEAELPGKSRNV